MLHHKCLTISLSLGCLLLIIMTITTSASAFASSGGDTVSSTITGASLTETNSVPIINNVTLNGLNQTLTVTMPIDISDSTGSGAGWNVTITSTTTPVATLSGVAQDAVYTFPITFNDATGSALGWKLTITSTMFTGAAHSLSTNASTILGVGITPGTGTTPLASTVSPVTYSMGLPGASATAVRFFQLPRQCARQSQQVAHASVHGLSALLQLPVL